MTSRAHTLGQLLAATAVAAMLLGTALPASAAPITWSLSGFVDRGAGSGDLSRVPLGPTDTFHALLTYDPTLPLFPLGYGAAQHEPGASLGAQFGAVTASVTGTDVMQASLASNGIQIIGELPSGRLAWTSEPGRLLLSLFETFHSGPVPIFEPGHMPDNLDALRPPDWALQLIVFHADGTRTNVVAAVTGITRVAEPATLGLLGVPMVALLAVRRRRRAVAL